MFSNAANRPGIATLLHRPQQRPSGGNYFTSAPASCSLTNVYRNSLEDTCRPPGTATRGDRCAFLTFPVVSVEVGQVLPPAQDSPAPLPARREGVIGGVRGSHLFPLEQRRTVALWRRGSKSGTCPLSRLTTRARTHTQTHTGITCMSVTQTKEWFHILISRLHSVNNNNLFYIQHLLKVSLLSALTTDAGVIITKVIHTLGNAVGK